MLLEREDMWRFKSRATWLECGDDNTKFCMLMLEGEKKLTLSRANWMTKELLMTPLKEWPVREWRTLRIFLKHIPRCPLHKSLELHSYSLGSWRRMTIFP